MPKRKKNTAGPLQGQQSMLSFFSKSSSSPPSKRPDIDINDDSDDSDNCDKSAEPTASSAVISTPQDPPGKEGVVKVTAPQDPPRKEGDVNVTTPQDPPSKEGDVTDVKVTTPQDPPSKEGDVKVTTPQDPPSKESTSNPSNKKFARKWLNQFKWLVYDAKRDLMYCQICLDARRNNTFTSGTDNFRVGTMEIHLTIDDHKTAVEAENLRPNNVAVVVRRMLDAREEAVVAAMRNIYYLAKENIPSVKYASLNKLCEMQGCGALAALRVSENATYTHWDTVTDMQQAISDVLREDLHAKISTSKYIGTMTDESTDISVEKLLLTYINLITPEGKVEAHYLCNTQVTTCDAASITTTFKEQLASNNINLNSVTGMCTDGAAVMVGKTSGVVARLKEENPIITGTHCAPHKLNLAAQQAAKNFPSLQRYQRLVGNIYGYFSNSASRQARLKEMTDILETDSVKLKAIHAVRWLSYNEANLALHRTLPAVKEVLKTDGEELHDANAEGLAKAIMSYEFLAYNHLMCDILGAIAILSKGLQEDALSFASVQPAVESAVNTLRAMQLGDGGPKFADFLASITEVNGDDPHTLFKGERIKATPQMRQAVQRARNDYINQLIDNMETRFPDTGIVSAFKIFDPKNLPANRVARAQYGREELDTVLDHFCPAGRQPLVNRDGCRNEWMPFKELVRANYPDATFRSLVIHIMTQHAAYLPETAKLLQAVAVVPVTTVPCERGFSVQNRIKTKGRARLKASTLDVLMRINIEGPPITDFDFERALGKWRTAKPRRIFQQRP